MYLPLMNQISAEHDERQRADDIGRRLGFRRHRADLELHLRRACAARRRGCESVSARLPPVSRWIASVITKNWNSGVPSRSAVSCSAASIVRPIFILSDDGAELVADRALDLGRRRCPSSRKSAGPSAGRAPSARSRRGSATVNLLIRRWISLPTTKWGRPMPTNDADRQGEQQRRALEQQQHRRRPRRGRPKPSDTGRGVQVAAGLLEPLAQQGGVGDQALGETVHLAVWRLARMRLSCTCAATSLDLLWRSRTALEPARLRLRRRRPGHREIDEQQRASRPTTSRRASNMRTSSPPRPLRQLRRRQAAWRLPGLLRRPAP